MINNTKKKYFSSIFLAIIGDKIGFDNGNREKNYDNIILLDENSEKMCEVVSTWLILQFISTGGIQGLDLNKLLYSDDTIMHLDTISALCDDYINRDKLYDTIVENYLESFKDINEMRNKYLAGLQTIEAIKDINSGVNWRKFQYKKNAGGSGGPMRTMCLGLAFNKNNNLLKLIESCIMISSITHPNCIAFIGSIASALFISYALNNDEPTTWIFNFIRLLDSEIIDNIIIKIKPNFIEYFIEDKKVFLYKLNTYVETSFHDGSYIVTGRNSRMIYPYLRMIYYHDNFSSNKKVLYPGGGSDDCIIIAYDSLLMSKDNYEHLIYNSMINIGDSDTVGTIASAWYGALYGFNGVPKSLINKSDNDYKMIKKVSKVFHSKYYDKVIKEF